MKLSLKIGGFAVGLLLTSVGLAAMDQAGLEKHRARDRGDDTAASQGRAREGRSNIQRTPAQLPQVSQPQSQAQPQGRSEGRRSRPIESAPPVAGGAVGGTVDPRRPEINRDRNRDRDGYRDGHRDRNRDSDDRNNGYRHDGGYSNGYTNNNGWNNSGHRPRRIINTLPYGYSSHHWNGRPYYRYGGSWYSPWGTSFGLVSPPYGLFVNSLSGPFSSFWYGNSRYYFADDTYYLYEPLRRGYVVSRSPYGDRDDEDDDSQTAADEDLYIYPARGQSEQQQSDDRYECHRWAANETGYDPIDSDYDADRREDYLRAMSACLTGRGYTVR